MKQPRITPRIKVAAIVISVAAAGGGVAIASAAGGSTPTAYGAAASSGGPSMTSPSTSSPSTSSPAGTPGTDTVHVTTATVNGKTEKVLVDAKGDPLYTFRSDTPIVSRVRGQLATLWPPLVASGTPTVSGAGGTLTVVATSNGRQVAYNGHFLYTFVDDAPGHVTGQGVQAFFVATPDTGGSAAAPVTAPPASSPTDNGYGAGNGYGY